MQNTPIMHNKASKPTSIESANFKDSTSLIISENSEISKGPENVNKIMENNLEKKINLLNSQITVSNNLYNKPKETESALNVIDTLRNKTAEILSKPNNRELEVDFRTTCSAIQNNSYDPLVMQTCQDYLNAYQQKTSLYNITRDYEEDRTYLYIYNTETEVVKKLQTTPLLNSVTFLTQLPNGKLFCFGNDERSGLTMLIGVNGGVEVLLSETSCKAASCIYFSSSVYCFGGFTEVYLPISMRFDLDQNRWYQLTPMPKADSMCNMIIFNGNILISGWGNRNIFIYSTDIDSFSTIPYEFEECKSKILINAERLYLIECLGFIYESEIGSFTNWRRIEKSIINCDSTQLFYIYNKGGIYISTIDPNFREYYYFNLDQKNIIDLIYYSNNYLLRRVGKKIEAIKWNNKSFKLDPYYLDEWDLKGMSLHELGKHLDRIECFDEGIKLYPNNSFYYNSKGDAIYCLRRYLEAIEYFEEAIKLNPNEPYFYFNKGNAFYSLKRYLEAIEYYDKAIELDPNQSLYCHNKGKVFYDLERYLEAIECYENAITLNRNFDDYYYNKGKAFYGLKRYLEAIECYEEAIRLRKFNPKNADYYYNKGYTLNELGRYQEAIESYDEAININPCNAKFYNDKGNTLCVLERYQEAIQCYDEAIKFEPNNPLHFCSRAKVFNNLRQEDAALQDFNTAYILRQKYQEGDVFAENEWEPSEKDINFINDILGLDRIELLQKMQI